MRFVERKTLHGSGHYRDWKKWQEDVEHDIGTLREAFIDTPQDKDIERLRDQFSAVLRHLGIQLESYNEFAYGLGQVERWRVKVECPAPKCPIKKKRG